MISTFLRTNVSTFVRKNERKCYSTNVSASVLFKRFSVCTTTSTSESWAFVQNCTSNVQSLSWYRSLQYSGNWRKKWKTISIHVNQMLNINIKLFYFKHYGDLLYICIIWILGIKILKRLFRNKKEYLDILLSLFLLKFYFLLFVTCPEKRDKKEWLCYDITDHLSRHFVFLSKQKLVEVLYNAILKPYFSYPSAVFKFLIYIFWKTNVRSLKNV